MFTEVLPLIFFLLTEASQVPRGWEPIPSIPQSFVRLKGMALIWIEVQRGKGYEQPVFVESPGAVVVMRAQDGRIGFIKQHRIHRPRLLEALTWVSGHGYVAALHHLLLWKQLLTSHPGSLLFELPGGNVELEDLAPGLPYEEAVRRVALREALQEAGCEGEIEAVYLDCLNANPVYYMHGQSVVVMRVTRMGPAQPEPEEAIHGRFWLTPEEVRLALRERRIVDSRTAHALLISGVLD